MTGEELKNKRVALGLTQAQLAKMFGKSARTIITWENSEEISPATVKLIEAVLTVDKILNDNPTEEEQKNRSKRYAEQINKIADSKVNNFSGFYYPDVSASAGLETAFENSELAKIPVSIPNFGKDIDFINVYGDSMYPKYCSGEIIGIKEVEPKYLNYGYAYVVVFKDGQVFLKYIQKGKDDNHWILASENEKYDPKEYHLNLIKKVYIIKGVITKTTM